MSAEPWRKHFWRNTATNYLGVVTRIGSGLVLFRLLFQHMDHEQFGYYSLLWSLFGYAILLDFGLGVAVQKAVARKIRHRATRMASTGWWRRSSWSFAAMGIGLFWNRRSWPSRFSSTGSRSTRPTGRNSARPTSYSWGRWR